MLRKFHCFLPHVNKVYLPKVIKYQSLPRREDELKRRLNNEDLFNAIKIHGDHIDLLIYLRGLQVVYHNTR